MIEKIIQKFLKPFLGRGLGEKFPILRNLFYRQLSRLVIGFLSPVTINSTSSERYKLYLPANGIDYIVAPYEEFHAELIRKNLKPGNTFLDIGAGIGYHSVIASKVVGEKGKVICFEPSPANFKLLQKNIEENGCNNVTLFRKAVSDRNGKTKLYIYDKAGRNRIEEVNYLLVSFNFNILDSLEIESVKLDSLLENEKIDFIKMDIEGAEYLAIEGMKSLIKKNRQVKIITEMPDYKTLEFLKLLKQLGFKIQEMDVKGKNLYQIENPNEFIRKINEGEKEISDLFCER